MIYIGPISYTVSLYTRFGMEYDIGAISFFIQPVYTVSPLSFQQIVIYFKTRPVPLDWRFASVCTLNYCSVTFLQAIVYLIAVSLICSFQTPAISLLGSIHARDFLLGRFCSNTYQPPQSHTDSELRVDRKSAGARGVNKPANVPCHTTPEAPQLFTS